MSETQSLDERLEEAIRRGDLGAGRDILLESLDRGDFPGTLISRWLEHCEAAMDFRLADALVAEIEQRCGGLAPAWFVLAMHAKMRANWARCESAVCKARERGMQSRELSLLGAMALEKQLRPEETLAWLDAEPELAEDVRAWTVRADAMNQLKQYRQAIDHFKPRLEVLGEDGDDAHYIASLWLALGRMHDRLGEPEQAWTCFARGHGIRNDVLEVEHSSNPVRRHIEVSRRLYSPDWVARWSPTPPAGDDPVFLVGFPRSGTTLLEQMLDAHPRIQALEEKPMMGHVFAAAQTMLQARAAMKGRIRPGMDWRESELRSWRGLATLGEGEIELLRREYRRVADAFLQRQPGSVFVDKLPLNLVKVGLIQRIFPDARFILALRHPCDSVLSCYMQGFEINSAMVNFTEITQAARFYRQAMRLFWQFQNVFNLEDRVLSIRYEDILQDQRGELTRLLEFLGLDWDPAVADYDRHARDRGTLNTPSYEGVTQKLYTRASGRWRSYAQWLEPVFPDLREACERFGYSLDPEAATADS